MKPNAQLAGELTELGMAKEKAPGRDEQRGTMRLAYSFSSVDRPELAEVGGKALSLVAMTRHGLPVPR